MIKKIIVLTILVILLSSLGYSDANQWGNINLLFYYDSMGMQNEVLDKLNKIDLTVLPRSEQDKIVKKLIALADSKLKTNKKLSKLIYMKIIKEAPKYWFVENKIVYIEKNGDKPYYNFKTSISQLIKIGRNFASSFLILNFFVNSFLYALLFVLFIFALVLLLKYFKLFANDTLINTEMGFIKKNIIMVLVFFMWPLLFFSGWIIYPFIIFGIFYRYLSKSERRTVYTLFVLSVVALLIFSFVNVLTNNFKSEDFKTDRLLCSGDYNSDDYSMLNNNQKVVYALLNYRKGLLLKTMEILNSVDEDRYREMKEVLLGNLYYKKYIHSSGIDKTALDKSIEHYLKVLRENKDNKVAVNNLAIALIRTVHDKDMEKVYASYVQRYPELDDMKYSILKLKTPVLDENYLWKCLLMQPDDSFNPLKLLKNTLIKFISYPFMYFFLIFLLYAKFIKKLFRLLGTSTKCSKCSKIINKKNIHKSYNLCNDCHQLFLIKDVIFLEAKLLKEKEIKKKNLHLFMKIVLSSIFIPGLNLNFKQKNNMFVILSVFLYFFFIFGLTGFLGFKSLGLSVPYIFNISGIIAAVLYFMINIFSIKGEDYGI